MPHGKPRRHGLARVLLALALAVPLGGCEVVAMTLLGGWIIGEGIVALPGAIADEINETWDPALVREHAAALDRAECGDKGAQSKAARNYKTARGTGYDYAEAYFWYSLAAGPGVYYSDHPRDEVGDQLKPRERAEVDARVAAWVPRDCTDNPGPGPVDLDYLVDLEKAACGDGAAQFALARRYNFGDGPDKDPQRAYYWISVAESQGLPGAAYYRAQLRDSLAPEARAEIDARVAAWAPRDCPPNIKAFRLRTGHLANLERAACGNIWAQNRVASDFETGRGTEKDLQESYFWFSLAAKDKESRYAVVSRDQVGRELTPEARAEVDARVRAWAPRDCPSDRGKAKS